ncbi:ABC transporter ATP-binding protein [Salinactinospora qingdaonensis]|uniref:ABC transporter ATP-binding protein n=1 Tax=Salinactinospora qingdaonensis TaxID=702744 RepID=A0ABP7FV06_9ACTN
MISIENLSKSFGPRTLWSEVNLTIRPEEMLALVGPSGTGKSTLLNCLGLLETTDSGRILVDGHDITRLSISARRRFRRDNLGYLFQNYALIDNATIAANLDVATDAGRLRPAGRRAGHHEALERVGLAGREKEKVHYLSGGEQQRVALARLIVKKPSLVLADEPTGALDKDNTALVVDVLRDLSHTGCAVVIATHQDHVRDSCDTAFAVDTGHLTHTTLPEVNVGNGSHRQ